MAFYAKGSPGAFLHLTQTADARAGVTADTIFHSSLPYVMFNGVWECSLSNLPASATTRGESAKAPWYDRALVNYLPELRVGVIPAGAVAALNDPTAVVLTEIEYVVGGVTYTKVITGVTMESGRHNINADGYAARWQNFITPRHGIDAFIGYYKGGITGDPRDLINSGGSFGLETYLQGGVSDDGNGDIPATWCYKIGYNYQNKRDFLPKTQWIKTSAQGRGFNTVAIAPMCRFATPDMEPLPNSFRQKKQTAMEIWRRPISVAGHYDYGYEGIRIPVACTFNNEFIGQHSSTKDSYGEFSRYTGVTYTKVRWYRLNLKFNMGTGFSITNLVPSTGEVKISNTEFSVDGKKLSAVTGGILYQVNRRTRNTLRLLTAGNNYPSATWTTERGVFPMTGITQAGAFGGPGVDNKSTIIPATGMQSSYLAFIEPSKSTKWTFTKDAIGDQNGTIWGSGGNKALQLIAGQTAKATIPTSTKAISPSVNTSQMVAKIALGLPRSGDATVVLAITTTDYKTVMPGDTYFLPFQFSYNKQPNGTEIFGKPEYFFLASDTPWPETKVGDHSILNLPIGRFVPFMVHRLNNMETLWWDTPSCQGRHWTVVYWLKNVGDGTVEVHMTQKQDNPYSWMDYGLRLSFTQLFHTPALNVYIHRLT